MTAKEYLEQLPGMRLRIAAIERKIVECRHRATNTASNQSGEIPQHNGAVSCKVADCAVQSADYETELKQIKSEFEAFERRASAEINRIPDNLLSAVLFEKYINGLTWDEVAMFVGKDADYVRKGLHGIALAKFDEVIPENTRKCPCIPAA